MSKYKLCDQCKGNKFFWIDNMTCRSCDKCQAMGMVRKTDEEQICARCKKMDDEDEDVELYTESTMEINPESLTGKRSRRKKEVEILKDIE